MKQKAKNYTKKAIVGISSILIMYALGLLFSLLFRMLLARNLSVAEYGLYYAMYAFFSIIFILKDFGMGAALSKFLPEWIVKKENSKIKQALAVSFTYTIAFSIVIFVLSLLFAKPVAAHFFKQTGIDFLFVIFSIAFSMLAIQSFIVNVYAGHQKMVYYSIVGILQPALLLLFTFLLFRWMPNIGAAAFGLLLASAFVVASSLPLVFKLAPKKTKTEFNQSFIKSFTLFGFQMLLVGIGAYLLQYTDSLVLTYFKSLDTVGLYNAALPIANILVFLSSAITTITLPMFSEFFARNLRAYVKEAFFLIYKYSVALALPIIAVLVCFPGTIISLIFGSSYLAAAIPLQILVWGGLFNILGQTHLSYFNASGRPMLSTKIMGFVAVLNLLINIALVPTYGMAGSAFATSLSSLFILAISAGYIRKELLIKLPIWSWIKNIFCCAAMIAAMVLLKRLIVLPTLAEIVVVLAVSMIVYALLMLLLRVVVLSEIKDILRRLF
jgi:O-antigen/teichoic acid export membrane protein